MPDRAIDVDDPAPSGAASAPVLAQERPSTTIAAALTVDPGTSGTTFTFASTALFPPTGTFKAKVESEVVLATVASGTTLTVTRAQDGTTGVAHAIGKMVAQLGVAQYVVPIANRSIAFCGAAGGFRTLGNAAAPQNLFSIENAAGSAVLLGVRKLSVEMDATAVLATVAPEFSVSRPTALPTGGTTLTKVAQDTALTSSASVVLRCATASDGGAATAITATAGGRLWHQFQMRLHTAVGQVLPDDYNLLPAEMADTDYIVLRAGEALLVQVVGTAASNAATNHYVCKCAWDEYSIP